MKEFIVIGAGILGASTAYHLADNGADVLLIDRNDKGQATNAGAGIICPWLTNRKNKAWYKLVISGAKFYPTLVRKLNKEGEQNTGYAQVGAINIFDTDDKLNKKMQFALKRKKESPEMGEVSRLSALETQAMFPPLSEKYGAIHVSGGARVDGQAMRDALIRAAIKKGTTLLNGSATLLTEGSNVIGAKVAGESYLAKKIIVTEGAWSKELLEPLGMNFEVTSQKAQIVHLEMPNTDTSDWPVVLPPFNQYMLTFDGGKIVIGATHEDHVGLDHRVTMGGVHSIISKALKVAPGLSTMTYVETKVGFRPFTPGYLPVIGPVPNVNGLLVANGLGASGLTSGPYFGAELAKLALNQPTDLNIKDYDVSNAFL